ncbi:MAG: nitroreductase family protein [Zoogloeaceae bacterium]|nr:nitroreductase family protein [Zoogloeaceae bacterium]
MSAHSAYEDLMALLRSRHSCRNFAPEPLDAQAQASLREAFSLAPQAGGGRKLTCSFVTGQTRIRELAESGAAAFAARCETISSGFIREEMSRYGENFFWFAQAPTLAVITCQSHPAFLDKSMESKAALAWGGELSGAMASFALLLAAESLGLGACCLTGPLTVWREMETRLGIPKRESLVLLVALGYKTDTPKDNT